MRLYDVPYTAPHVSSLSDADLNQMIVRLLARGPQWIKPMPELEYRCPNQLCKCGSFRMFSPDEGVHIVLRCARCQTLIVVGKIEGLNAATELEVIDPCGDCGLTASEPKK